MRGWERGRGGERGEGRGEGEREGRGEGRGEGRNHLSHSLFVTHLLPFPSCPNHLSEQAGRRKGNE